MKKTNLDYVQVNTEIRDSLYWETLNDHTAFTNSYRSIEEAIAGVTFFLCMEVEGW